MSTDQSKKSKKIKRIASSKKVALFIDANDFEEGYFGKDPADFRKEAASYDALINMYKGLTDAILGELRRKDLPCGIQHYYLEHVGNYLAVPVYRAEDLADLELDDQEILTFVGERRNASAYHRRLDALQGFILRYVHPRTRREDKGKPVLERKGVDAELICQALIGAMSNDYDVACLLSDNAEYVPLVERVHDFFNKQVIQVGFKDDARGVTRLQAACYGHIDLDRWT